MTTIDPTIAQYIEQLIQAERETSDKQQEQLRAALDDAKRERDELKVAMAGHQAALDKHREITMAQWKALDVIFQTLDTLRDSVMTQGKYVSDQGKHLSEFWGILRQMIPHETYLPEEEASISKVKRN